MSEWQNKRLDLDYGPTIRASGHKATEPSREARDMARMLVDVPDMRRRFESMMDAKGISADEQRKVMASLKRMASYGDADDLDADIVAELRRLAREFA
jgi:predicted Mrr-cat superfamily restriction endonuclease